MPLVLDGRKGRKHLICNKITKIFSAQCMVVESWKVKITFYYCNVLFSFIKQYTLPFQYRQILQKIYFWPCCSPDNSIKEQSINLPKKLKQLFRFIPIVRYIAVSRLLTKQCQKWGHFDQVKQTNVFYKSNLIEYFGKKHQASPDFGKIAFDAYVFSGIPIDGCKNRVSPLDSSAFITVLNLPNMVFGSKIRCVMDLSGFCVKFVEVVGDLTEKWRTRNWIHSWT